MSLGMELMEDQVQIASHGGGALEVSTFREKPGRSLIDKYTVAFTTDSTVLGDLSDKTVCVIRHQ